MKKIQTVFIAGVVCVMLMVAGCGQSGGESAIEYNDRIINHQTKVVNSMMALVKTFEGKDLDVMMGKLEALNTEIDAAVAAVSAMEGFDGDTSLRDALVELLKFYKGIFSNEYKEMIQVIGAKTPPSAEEFKKMTDIQQDVAKREQVLDAKLDKIQKEFAQKYNILIKPNELQKKIDEM